MSKSLFKLVRTCAACPEQYDVYLDETCIGYMRLRWGFFRAEYREITVYTAETEGDGLFKGDRERKHHLNAACRAIKAAMDNEEKEELYEIS